MKPSPIAAAPGFDSLPLAPAVQANLARLGYTAMTPVQAAALPLALAGHDLIAQAPTGSGKTAAFALALLARLDLARLDVQALVLCPTRELAEQVAQDVRRLARADDNVKVLTLCGGTPIRPQQESLAHGAHVAVGTPGRLIDHLERGNLRLGGLRTLVLDEADRLLDMGFADAIASVVAQTPKARQTLLFSATWPPEVDTLARRLLRAPKEVRLAAPHAADKIVEHWFEVLEVERLHAVSRLLSHYRPARTLAFCNTRQQCRDLVSVLQAEGIDADALHGELEQRERDQVLIRFGNRSLAVLVATDVAARGLDVVGLEAVLNVDVASDADAHLHRIGRTGRADAEGLALNLASLDEMGRVGRIELAQGRASAWLPLSGLAASAAGPPVAPMVTLQILGGRKDKLRPGDVLGALTGEAGFQAAQIGKIDVGEHATCVAVERAIAGQALERLAAGKVKGRKMLVRPLAGRLAPEKL